MLFSEHSSKDRKSETSFQRVNDQESETSSSRSDYTRCKYVNKVDNYSCKKQLDREFKAMRLESSLP